MFGTRWNKVGMGYGQLGLTTMTPLEPNKCPNWVSRRSQTGSKWSKIALMGLCWSKVPQNGWNKVEQGWNKVWAIWTDHYDPFTDHKMPILGPQEVPNGVQMVQNSIYGAQTVQRYMANWD